MYRARASFHVETHHYCYPSMGIEMPLGSLPVVDCNLWDPEPSGVGDGPSLREGRRAEFWSSGPGADHLTALKRWEDNRAVADAEDEEARQLIARSMDAAPPQIACQSCGQTFNESELDIEMRCTSCRSRLRTLNPQKHRTGDKP